jgi:hypothetical protein
MWSGGGVLLSLHFLSLEFTIFPTYAHHSYLMFGDHDKNLPLPTFNLMKNRGGKSEIKGVMIGASFH